MHYSADIRLRSMSNNKSNTNNLLIAIFASMMAPLISRLIHLYIVDEQEIWSTENILVIYLSSVVGFIISDKIYRVVKNSGLYARGIKLGDADAFRFAVWFFPVVLSLQLKSKVSVVALLVMTIMSIFVLIKDKSDIHIDLKQLCIIAFVTVAALFSGLMNMDRKMYLRLFVGIIIVVIIFDVFAAIMRRWKR